MNIKNQLNFSDLLDNHAKNEHELFFIGGGVLSFAFYAYFMISSFSLWISPSFVGAGYVLMGIYMLILFVAGGIVSGPFLYHFFDFFSIKEKTKLDTERFSNEIITAFLFLFKIALTTGFIIVIQRELTILSFLVFILLHVLSAVFYNKTKNMLSDAFLKLFFKEAFTQDKVQSNVQDPNYQKDNVSELSKKIQTLQLVNGFNYQPFMSEITYINQNSHLLNVEDKHRFELLISDDIPQLISSYNALDEENKKEMYPMVFNRLEKMNSFFKKLKNTINDIKRTNVIRSIEIIDGRFESEQ